MALEKVGIIGIGNVGAALSRGCTRAGREIRAVGKRDKSAVRETADWGTSSSSRCPSARWKM